MTDADLIADDEDTRDRTMLTKTAPERIWLQVSEDEDHHCEPFPRHPHGDEVTWCQDSVLACEVEYVRADLYEERGAQLDVYRSKVVSLILERDAERQRAGGLRAERDNAHALIKLLSDSKRYCVTENIGHDWVPVEVSVLAGMKRCPICGTSWPGSGTPDVCPTPHLHKAMPRVWRCKVCGLSERVHRMSGHPSRNHKPQMELTDANRNEVTTAAGNSNRDESRRGGS